MFRLGSHSHCVTVCFFFMSSGGRSWDWYVTHSVLLEANKRPAVDCAAACVFVCVISFQCVYPQECALCLQ